MKFREIKFEGIKFWGGIIAVFTVIMIVFYIIHFNGGVSKNNSDWGFFGEYFGGIITPILTALNIYIFYKLTRTISEIDKQNVEKQLIHSTCKEYQSKINDLVLEFLKTSYEVKREEAKIEIAKERLSQTSYLVDSFVFEIDIFISENNKPKINDSKENLMKSINTLKESNLEDKNLTHDFLVKKSEFINLIFSLIR